MNDIDQKDYAAQFSEEQSSWTQRISELSIRMRNIREIADVQVELFSDRQKLLERCHKLGQTLSKLNAEYRKRKRDQLIKRSDENLRYGANEKTTLIDGDLAELRYMIDLVDGHISGLNGTEKTIDHALYGIKERIKLEDYLRNGSVR